MFDSVARRLIDPPLNSVARRLAAFGMGANTLTIAGGICALGVIGALALEWYLVAASLIVLNRLADGLDGAVARIKGPTDYGGYLDIVFDFLFYNGVVFGFVLANPQTNGVPGAFLMLSFVGTGITFLTFAILAAKRGVSTSVRGKKSFYYVGGLTEGTETIIAVLSMCIWPDYFAVIAWVFGAACWVTTLTRLRLAQELFDDGVLTPDVSTDKDD